MTPRPAGSLPSERNIPSIARNFVIAALVTASLLKLAEALFNSFWSATDSTDVHNPIHVIPHLYGGIRFIVFYAYAFILLGRHFTAIYAPEIMARAAAFEARTSRAKTGVFVILDFTLTISVLTMHYVLAHGLAEAARDNRFPVQVWPLAGFLWLCWVLLSHIAVCTINYVWAARVGLPELKDLLSIWITLSGIELLICISCLWLFAWSASFLIPLGLLLVVSYADFKLASRFWRSLESTF